MADTQTLYDELRTFLTENNIPIAHSVENFDALINTFYGREEDNVWATDLMSKHFDTYRTEDGSIDPQAAVDINAYLEGAGAGAHANFDATASGDSGPISTGAPLPLGTERVGTGDAGQTLPVEMRLVRVTNPAGSDQPALYFAVGTVFGVDVAYEIGNQERLDSLFGGVTAFADVATMSQGQFDNADILSVGDIDEIAGSTESLQAQYERDIRAAGLESPPAWMLADTAAMATFITGTNEGWSAERTWQSLSSLDSFQNRFVGLDVVKQQLGGASFTDAITEYTEREAGIRSFILASRGPNADTSPDYVKNLVASGWQPAEVGELLSLEKRVKDNPEALDNINQILAYQGLDTLAPGDFVSFLRDQDAITTGGTPSDTFEGINDALRFQALLTEGLEIDLGFATELGTGSSDAITSTETFSQQAQLAAGFIAANSTELDFAKMGLERDDIIAAAFGEAREGGKTVAETNAILEQFARERSKAAQGFAGSQSFIGASGRIQTQGFNSFS